jgi:DNA topoisomerase-1
MVVEIRRWMLRMPSVTRLARAIRLVTMPETRGVIIAAARSETLRSLARRAVNDRPSLVRDLRDPANARDLIGNAARHPAARELASAGLMFLPVRYLPLGMVATWATRRLLRRYVDPPEDLPDKTIFGANRLLKNVTPEARQEFPPYEVARRGFKRVTIRRPTRTVVRLRNDVPIEPAVAPVAPSPDVALRYSSDTEAGIGRRRSGRGFRYVGPDSTPIRDPATLARIRALAVPPAWRDVWICRDARGHLQATGSDARGRKQPRYHAAWRRQRDELKFGRLAGFGRALPKIRRRVKHDIALPGLTRDKVLATVVALLETTALRVGSDEYARANRSCGLTTLRNRHVTVIGPELRFRFRGKGGAMQVVDLHGARVARSVTRCGALPGQELFQYVDERGDPRPIESADVNAYLRDAAGIDVTAKDFRTWIGTLLAFHELRAGSEPGAVGNRQIAVLKRSLERVARTLGNTPAVSRERYVAPSIVDAYLDGFTAGGSPRRPSAGAGTVCPRTAGGTGARALPRAGRIGDVEDGPTSDPGDGQGQGGPLGIRPPDRSCETTGAERQLTVPVGPPMVPWLEGASNI